MDFIVDNAVPLSAIACALLVLAGLVLLALSGLRLWRRLRAVQRRIGEASASLSAEAARLSAAQAAMPARQAEVADAVASLGARVRVLGVLLKSAGEAVAVLRAPLTYLGR